MHYAKLFRTELFGWFACFGLALHVFGLLDGFLKLSQIARWIVLNWDALTYDFWNWVADLVSIRLPDGAQPFLTTIAFIASVTIGARFDWSPHVRTEIHADDVEKSFFDSTWAFAYTFSTLVLLVPLASQAPIWTNATLLIPLLIFVASGTEFPIRTTYAFLISITILSLALLPLAEIEKTRGELRQINGYCVSDVVTISSDFTYYTLAAGYVLLPTLPAIAPMRFLNFRFYRVGMLVLTLLTMNEIAKLGYDTTPPFMTISKPKNANSISDLLMEGPWPVECELHMDQERIVREVWRSMSENFHIQSGR